jgi:hypothetical protein
MATTSTSLFLTFRLLTVTRLRFSLVCKRKVVAFFCKINKLED